MINKMDMGGGIRWSYKDFMTVSGDQVLVAHSTMENELFMFPLSKVDGTYYSCHQFEQLDGIFDTVEEMLVYTNHNEETVRFNISKRLFDLFENPYEVLQFWTACCNK